MWEFADMQLANLPLVEETQRTIGAASHRRACPFTYLRMVPTSAGSDGSRLADRLSSVSVDISQRAAGNSDRALFDRLRLRSLQNLKKGERVVSSKLAQRP